jgi:acetoin:2,6-dichlorophenolindophenol oxidoreductase subunit alpha
VSFFGDGAVSQGVLLESMNLAALWRAPVLFICENNGYATTLTVRDAVAGTITGRGEAFGIPSVTVDGSDPVAVLDAARTAVELARAGGGPSLIECVCYRFDAHHTWEHKARVRYRDDREVASGRTRDPVEIAGARLSPQERADLDAEIEKVMDHAVEFALSSPHPDPAGALDHLYASGMRARSGGGW